MLEVCFFQHTPTFIIEPIKTAGIWDPADHRNEKLVLIAKKRSMQVSRQIFAWTFLL